MWVSSRASCLSAFKGIKGCRLKLRFNHFFMSLKVKTSISGQGSELFDRLRKTFDQSDQCCGLGIGRCSTLLPVFERSSICSQVHSEH